MASTAFATPSPGSRIPMTPSRRALREEVVRLSLLLEAHLDREEAHLVPVLERLTSLPGGM